MSEQFSILIDNHSRFERGRTGGAIGLLCPPHRSSYTRLCGASALPPTTRRIFPWAAIAKHGGLPVLMCLAVIKWYAPQHGRTQFFRKAA